MATDQEAVRPEVGSLRDPAELMRPERLSALKQTRLSFARLLMDKMVREQWDISVERVKAATVSMPPGSTTGV